MKKALMKLVLPCVVLCAALCVHGDELRSSALLWMVDDNIVNEVGGHADVPVSELTSRPDGLPVNYVRVLAVQTDGSESAPVFLNLFASDGLGGLSEMGTFTDVTEGFAGPFWADVTGYEDPAWSFMLELGNFRSLGAGDVWTSMAYSEKATYEQLQQFIQSGEILDPTMTPWTGGAYTVPEPTSGLLLVLGGAFLALRRRRRAA